MRARVVGVFEGGGVRGIALTGAAAAAMELGYRFDRLVGTSAGAIVSSLVAAGYSADELRWAVGRVDWPSLVRKRSVLGKNLGMVLHGGFYSGKRLHRELRRLLEVKGVRTFGDLRPDSLTVVATDLNHGRGVVLPGGLAALGYDPRRFPVARTVLMSSSVPFVFRPVRLRDRVTGEELLMADGAMAARFPAQLVPPGSSSLGFRLRLPPDRHVHRAIRGPVSLATAVIGAPASPPERICRPSAGRWTIWWRL